MSGHRVGAWFKRANNEATRHAMQRQCKGPEDA